jgi:hypothetical protein
MARNNAGARAGAKNEVTAAVVNALSEAGVTGYADTMLKALHDEGEAMRAAGENAWSAIRNAFRTVLEKHGTDAATVVLSRFKDRAKLENEGADYGRALNYATTLGKAIKAVKAGKKLPATLWDLSRGAWNAKEGKIADLFADTKAKSGRKPGGKTSQTEKAGEPAKVSTAQSVGLAAVSSFKAKEAGELSEVLALVDALHGPFRKEWLTEAKALALAISARQAQAGTGTK